nr:MAG TPA: hypothetical protein [Caudoviricetes sp.]
MTITSKNYKIVLKNVSFSKISLEPALLLANPR